MGSTKCKMDQSDHSYPWYVVPTQQPCIYFICGGYSQLRTTGVGAPM